MRQLQIPGHVHVCRDGDFVVMLDVRRDRYWALEATRTAPLSSIVPGWPASAAGSCNGADVAGADAISAIELLIDKGLLCDESRAGKPATPVRLDLPRRELLADAAGSLAGPVSIARFLIAAATAATLLRCLPFEGVIERVKRRNHRRTERGGTDGARATQLVARFAALQPMLFSRRDACLFNSLALIEFLAPHGLHPQWVFGVQGRPFAAHCWVQDGDVLLNDTLEHVRRYTPIMVL